MMSVGLREAAKMKVIFLMAGPLRGEWGGVKGQAIKEKITFFVIFFFQSSKISTAIKLDGGEGLGLNGPTIKRRIFFCGFPYPFS